MLSFIKTKGHYTYKGLDSRKNVIKGKINAVGRTQAKLKIKEQGLNIISLQRIYFSQLFDKKIKLNDFVIFNKQLLTIIKSSIPLAQALSIVKNQCPKYLKTFIQHCKDTIKQGKPLSEALTYYDNELPNGYIYFIKAGEMNGNLAHALELSDHLLTQKIKFRKTLKKALTYPFLIILVSLAVVFGMIHFIIPQFQQMYQQMGSALPLTTQIVLNSFSAIQHYFFIYVLIGLILSITTFSLLKSHLTLTLKFQNYILQIPVLGRYLQLKEYIQWLTLMGSFLQSGIALKQALNTSSRALKLRYFKHHMQAVISMINNGHALSDSLLSNQWMDADDLSFIIIGENNGELGKSISQQANLLQNQITEKIESLSRLLEPIILVILALIIGSLLIALYLPLFQMGQLF